MSNAMNLSSPVDNLVKIHKPQIAALKKLGIFTVRDVLFHFPYKYLDFSRLEKIVNIKPGDSVTIRGAIKSIHAKRAFRGGLSLSEAIISDETGSLKVVWFNQPYLAETFSKGDEIFLAGNPDYYKGSLQLTNPIYEKASELQIHTARLVPVYHLTQSLYPKTFRNIVASVIHLAGEAEDILPPEILKNQNLLSIAATITNSHFPEHEDRVEEAKKRLAFEEIFFSQLLAQKHRLELQKKKNYAIPFNQTLVKSFLETLPFELTPAQKKAAWEILQDISKQSPMNRLLEGDVGSGKTLVALIAALQTANKDLQVAFLAPTEILAKQHSESIKKFFDPLGAQKNIITYALLTNHYSEVNGTDETKAKLHKLIAEGMPGIFVGTHALLAQKVTFKKLALVIIDEQHRFGVQQRASLMKNTKKVPHLLSLSATPIPRTLQLACYGELEISQIKTKPLGRRPIITKLVNDTNRQDAYEFVRKQLQSGRQAFVITPLVEESDKLGVKAVTTEIKLLEKIFPEFKIGLMHGRLKGQEKEDTMADFLANKTQILVTTSVVEVGVDIPNASVMIIEGAERFGLAQLHQFRGRVGRAGHQSYCILFPTAPSELFLTEAQIKSKQQTLERLQSFTTTQDGFVLAELDLKQRGFGEMYGSSQSGWNFKYFSAVYTSLIQPARQEALHILQRDLELQNYPLLKNQLGDRVIHFE